MKTQRTLCFYRFLIVSCTLLFSSFFAFGQSSLTVSSSDKIEMFFERKTLTLDEANTYANGGTPIYLKMYMKVPATWVSSLGNIVMSFSELDYKITPSGEALLMYGLVGGTSCNGGFNALNKGARIIGFNIDKMGTTCNANSKYLVAHHFGMGGTIEFSNYMVSGHSNIVEIGSIAFKLPQNSNGFDAEVGAWAFNTNVEGYGYGTREFAILNLQNSSGAGYRVNETTGFDFFRDPSLYDFTTTPSNWTNGASGGKGGITVLAGLGTLS